MLFSHPPQQHRMGIAGAAVGCPAEVISRPGNFSLLRRRPLPRTSGDGFARGLRASGTFSFQPADEPGTFWRNACRSGGRVLVECAHDYIGFACRVHPLSISRGASVTRTDFMGLSAGATPESIRGLRRLCGPAIQRGEASAVRDGEHLIDTQATQPMHVNASAASDGAPHLFTCKRGESSAGCTSAHRSERFGRGSSAGACVAPCVSADCHGRRSSSFVRKAQSSGIRSVTEASTQSSAIVRKTRRKVWSHSSSAHSKFRWAAAHCSSDIKFSFVHLLVRQASQEAVLAAHYHHGYGLGLAHNQTHNRSFNR
jgi:hypothetical protein